MCYAFTDRFARVKFDCELDSFYDESVAFPMTTKDEACSKVQSLKRSADTVLENGKTKAAKHTESMTVPNDEELHGMQLKLAQAASRENELLKKIETIEDENAGLIYENAALQVKVESMQGTKLKAELNKTREEGKLAIQKGKQTIRAELQKHFKQKTDKATLDQKHKTEDLKERHAAELEEIRTKNQELEKETKNAKTHYAQAEKDMKAEHQKALKDAKAEFQQQVKELKPERSKAMKEKDNVLKDKQKQIAELQQAKEKHQQKVNILANLNKSMQAEKTSMHAESKEKDNQIEKIQNSISAAYEELDKWTQNKEKSTADQKAEREHTTQLWEVEHNKAQRFSADLTLQQQTNSVLRQNNERQAKQIEELEIRLLGAEETIQGLRSRSDATRDALTQTEDCEEVVVKDPKAPAFERNDEIIQHADIKQSGDGATGEVKLADE